MGRGEIKLARRAVGDGRLRGPFCVPDRLSSALTRHRGDKPHPKSGFVLRRALIVTGVVIRINKAGEQRVRRQSSGGQCRCGEAGP